VTRYPKGPLFPSALAGCLLLAAGAGLVLLEMAVAGRVRSAAPEGGLDAGAIGAAAGTKATATADGVCASAGRGRTWP
jgi:hypothetical protein